MTGSYTVNDLRADMAATIKALRSGDENMTVEKAAAISNLGQTIINSAKVEVDMMRALGHRQVCSTGFVPLPPPETPEGGSSGAGTTPRVEGPRRQPHIRQPMGTGPRGTL